MRGSKQPNNAKAVRKTPKPAIIDVVAATDSTSTTMSRVMERLPADGTGTAIGGEDKKVLQGIAHGAEGFGNEYGSGPGVANADPNAHTSPPIPGDSASPAASAMTTRKTAKTKRS